MSAPTTRTAFYPLSADERWTRRAQASARASRNRKLAAIHYSEHMKGH